MKLKIWLLLASICLVQNIQAQMKVTVYTKSNSPNCVNTIQKLKKTGIDFLEVNVSNTTQKQTFQNHLKKIGYPNKENYFPFIILDVKKTSEEFFFAYEGYEAEKEFLVEYENQKNENTDVTDNEENTEEIVNEDPKQEDVVPKKTTPNNPSANAADFQKEVVERHNYWRAKLGIGPVKWSDELAKFAQEWTNELARRGCNNLEHRPGSGKFAQKYGENIYMSGGMMNTPTMVIDDFASEQKCFDHNTQTCKRSCGECGHYTQVIWEKTTEVGCAMVRCGDTEIWVCNYNPPGNYIGQKPYTPKK